MGTIPNMIVAETDDAKASKKLGNNARKIAQIVECGDGFIPTRRDTEEGSWWLN